MILLDTHVVAWLLAGEVERFPGEARRLLETEDLAASPLVGLELQYLHEIGRTTQPSSAVLATLGRTIGLRIADCSLVELIAYAASLSWTRDPFDRLIAAHASLERAPLLTADRNIQANLSLAVWDEVAER